MGPELITCQICKLQNQDMTRIEALPPKKLVSCERCGKYILRHDVTPFIDPNKMLGYKLIAWIRNFTEMGADPPEITRDVLNNVEASLPDYSPAQKMLILLSNIGRRTEYPGKSVTISPRVDYPLSWANNEKELVYYLQSLFEKGLIRLPSEKNKVINDLINQVEITPEGWSFLEKNAQKSSVNDQSFMPISSSSKLLKKLEELQKLIDSEKGFRSKREFLGLGFKSRTVAVI